MSEDKSVKFKSCKRKNLRTRRNSSDEEDEDSRNSDDVLSKLEETKLAQKLRIKPKGVNVIGLAIGHKVTEEEIITKNDPFKIKSGGIVNLKSIKAGKVNQVDDAYDVGIGTQFSAETNKRDEDEEMMKYIEEELSKKKGVRADNKDDMTYGEEKYLSPEEAALLSLPDHLRLGSTQRSEEMLSNQMLNGIPEVDLGIEAKIRNIEATEAAKEKLLMEQKNKKDGPSHFVPTNMAVNFVQHNRFNMDGDHRQRKNYSNNNTANKPANSSHSGQEKPSGNKRATDDYHYDKFRKQFRRY